LSCAASAAADAPAAGAPVPAIDFFQHAATNCVALSPDIDDFEWVNGTRLVFDLTEKNIGPNAGR
jgi:hypothetical protein